MARASETSARRSANTFSPHTTGATNARGGRFSQGAALADRAAGPAGVTAARANFAEVNRQLAQDIGAAEDELRQKFIDGVEATKEEYDWLVENGLAAGTAEEQTRFLAGRVGELSDVLEGRIPGAVATATPLWIRSLPSSTSNSGWASLRTSPRPHRGERARQVASHATSHPDVAGVPIGDGADVDGEQGVVGQAR